jgi:hypothetical protein
MVNGYNVYYKLPNITHHHIVKYSHHCITYIRLMSVCLSLVQWSLLYFYCLFYVFQASERRKNTLNAIYRHMFHDCIHYF